ncbi:MAG: hypothetical protein H0W73_06855 [Bacteroidetes bacterium]|nr:hypothetical protein [Bacteroidota bacterium]
MNQKTENEQVGRLWLWANAILQTQYLLKLAFRAEEAKREKFRIDEMEDYFKRLQEFAKTQPDYKEGSTKSSHQTLFNELHSQVFPTWSECAQTYDTAIELAIIYFCQVFTSGNSLSGSVAENNKTFKDEHLSIILDRVFQTQEEKEKFGILKTKIILARDKAIGHADGTTYEIIHGSTVSTMKGPKNYWRDIDFIFWNSFLERMRIASYNYANEIKIITQI